MFFGLRRLGDRVPGDRLNGLFSMSAVRGFDLARVSLHTITLFQMFSPQEYTRLDLISYP